MNKSNKSNENIQTAYTTLLIVAIALVSVAAATFAWFSIADMAKLSKMKFDITTGKSLRFDLDEHQSFDDYKQSLSFEDIRQRILKDTGVDIAKDPLEPVTTSDAKVFTYENGETADISSGHYYEFTLHFMSTCNMVVHLTSENSEDAIDGTMILSENADTPKAMRIGFLTDDITYAYDQELNQKTEKRNKITFFGLLPADKMVYNNTNLLFLIKEGQDVPLKVCVWLEGTDEACSNEIKESSYEIRLRFEGFDEESL